MYFHISYVSFGASNTLFFSHNVTLLLQNSASSASKIIRRKNKTNFEYLLILICALSCDTAFPTYNARDINKLKIQIGH